MRQLKYMLLLLIILAIFPWYAAGINYSSPAINLRARYHHDTCYGGKLLFNFNLSIPGGGYFYRTHSDLPLLTIDIIHTYEITVEIYSSGFEGMFRQAEPVYRFHRGGFSYC